MNANTAAALKAAHSPAARRKANRTLGILSGERSKLATKYNVVARSFTKGRLLETCKRLNIPLAAIPEVLFKPFPRGERKRLLAQRGNGHDKGVGIPLHAIPERKQNKTGEARAAWGSKTPKAKGHPNAELIGKVLDALTNPKTTDKIATRLSGALDKLLKNG